MASKRRNWLRRQARKNHYMTPKNGGFPCYWMHDAKYGNRAFLDRARGRDRTYTPVYAFCRFLGFAEDLYA